jgi:hypothetical protein
MIGDRDLNIYQEGNSVQSSPEVVQRVWQLAKQLGYDDYFISEVIEGITDDHLPLIKKGLRVIDVIDIDYAYPVPTLKRDQALRTIQPWLMTNDIYSRGRFGAWKYEIGNMDHAVKMGIDVARRVVQGTEEEVWTL